VGRPHVGTCARGEGEPTGVRTWARRRWGHANAGRRNRGRPHVGRPHAGTCAPGQGQTREAARAEGEARAGRTRAGRKCAHAHTGRPKREEAAPGQAARRDVHACGARSTGTPNVGRAKPSGPNVRRPRARSPPLPSPAVRFRKGRSAGRVSSQRPHSARRGRGHVRSPTRSSAAGHVRTPRRARSHPGTHVRTGAARSHARPCQRSHSAAPLSPATCNDRAIADEQQFPKVS
jgi:hypothetical protein